MHWGAGPTTAICSITWKRACSARWWWHEDALENETKCRTLAGGRVGHDAGIAGAGTEPGRHADAGARTSGENQIQTEARAFRRQVDARHGHVFDAGRQCAAGRAQRRLLERLHLRSADRYGHAG